MPHLAVPRPFSSYSLQELEHKIGPLQSPYCVCVNDPCKTELSFCDPLVSICLAACRCSSPINFKKALHNRITLICTSLILVISRLFAIESVIALATAIGFIRTCQESALIDLQNFSNDSLRYFVLAFSVLLS